MAKDINGQHSLDETGDVAVGADPHSYIAALKHFSARANTCAERNKMVDRLRKHTDAELAKMGIKRSEIEQLVYRKSQ